MKIVDKLLGREDVGKDEKYQRKIKVRFPNFTGDTSREMTIQEIRDNHSGCLLVDPRNGEQVDILDLTNLDRGIEEIVAMPPIQGG